MSSSPESASRVEELEAGLAALQSENYLNAIAQLTKFLSAESDLDQPSALKAKIGLVRAQIQSGQTAAAIALCQELQQSQNERARSWATQTIAKLAPVETGFVPIELTQKPRRKRVQPQSVQEKKEFPQEPQQTLAPLEQTKNTEPSQPEATSHVWQNAGRAQRWQQLPRINPARLHWAEISAVVALFLTLYGLWSSAIAASWMWFDLRRLLNLSPIVPDGEVSGLALGLSLLIAFSTSPWAIEAVLKQFYEMKPMTTSVIARHSAETHRLIQRFSQQHKIPIPKLGILPIQAPIIFTYGCLPKFARIVVSQGLLDCLAEDEIAAIYACELSHIAQWNFVWISLIAVALQMPYTLYRQCAIASNSLKAIKLRNAFLSKLLQSLADVILIISAIAYGLFSLFRWSGLWLSKARILYSDQQACNLTGNPNGLARALTKIAIATHQTIQHEKQTYDLLESFEILNPVSYRSAITIGTLFDRVSISTLFQWEQANRDRIKFMLDQSHPAFRDRLNHLMSYCQYWRLKPEFEIEESIPKNRPQILLEIAPLLGIIGGNAIALLLWLIAHGLHQAGIYQFNWLADDYSLFTAFSLIGFGIATLVHFNQFFRESRIETIDLIYLLTQPNLTTINSPKIRLEGTLIGRTGANNQLGQDLILQTETGLIKLNYCSQFGAIGNLLCRFPIGQTVTITGWFRRGVAPWIDVETIRARSSLQAGQQIWSILIALTAILLGLAQIM